MSGHYQAAHACARSGDRFANLPIYRAIGFLNGIAQERAIVAGMAWMLIVGETPEMVSDAMRTGESYEIHIACIPCDQPTEQFAMFSNTRQDLLAKGYQAGKACRHWRRNRPRDGVRNAPGCLSIALPDNFP